MPSPRRLVVEVGNSRWKAGLFPEKASRGGPPEPVATLRVAHADDPAPQLRAFLAEHAPHGAAAPAVWSGVNPAGAAALLAAWPTDCGPPPIELPRAALNRLIANGARQPERVGADRLLNALAAAALAPAGCEFAAVADCGTATTIDTVRLPAHPLSAGDRPEFLGGAILPGIVLCARALHAHTAQLPEVSFTEDAPADGRDTEAAIRFGVLEMQAAVVDRLLGGWAEGTAFQILTGGAAGLTVDRLRRCEPHLAPHLTLTGLFLAARDL
ncbi:type III pantothenate kinase [Alienimonas californiensis]|uniref:Type III pantothenate kinase n=1 Tax=Alienimonas californiensis TaxID=2527989 RepID=A0A517P6C9_9PLAN|nr:type III pantothenate kinase [Alienimonas californiensis]QDT14931.1 Type III pantothenate kinase [Alienimonas californiensis]